MRTWLAVWLALLVLAGCRDVVYNVSTATTTAVVVASPPASSAARPTVTLTSTATSTPPAASAGPPASTPTARSTPAATATAGAPTPSLVASAATEGATPVAAGVPAYSYPLGIPGRPLGDGFFIRDAYASENTWFNPGWWHTAEDWYFQGGGESGGARVYAVADGEVVYADYNYPGRVVIIRHVGGLYSLYGHLDPNLRVKVGQQVARGELIATVRRGGDPVPGHLHFEIRAFLTRREVNGAAPRYKVKCGVDCPPGPGYWPIKAPDHPSDLGWRSPTNVIARRAFGPAGGASEVVVASRPAAAATTLWSDAPGSNAQPRSLGDVALQSGQRFPLLAIQAGAEDERGTSAQAYRLWYRIALADGRSGWVQAAIPSTFDTGSDGRPDSIAFNFLPANAVAR